MYAYYHDLFTFPLPQGHRFPISKYVLLRERLAAEGILDADELRLGPGATKAELALVHSPDYIEKVLQGGLSERELRRLGFPWSPALVERSLRSVGSTITAARVALEDGIAVNLAGGTHHAYPDHGQGFCVFNDVAIAARVLQQAGLVRRVVIIDCDVHQGNGTAAIFATDPSVYTFSIHGARNFPFHKEASDLDVALEDGTQDQAYLAALDSALGVLQASFEADIAFYLAGADPFEGDTLGRLALTKAGLAARDRMVLDWLDEQGLPVTIVMSGGYAKNISDTVDIHFETIRLARQSTRTHTRQVQAD